MDKKNARALSTFGIENLLTRFVNLPAEPGDSGPAQQFRDLAGELIDTHLGCDRVPADRYCHFVAIFRRVWKARTIAQKKEASKRIEAIFNRLAALPAIDRPALAVDFTSELVISIRFATAPLLDILAMTLIQHRNELGLCERRHCPAPYYVKSHPRQKYCSHDCANLIREESKSRWWADNREHFMQKWRRERKGR